MITGAALQKKERKFRPDLHSAC